VRPPEPTALLKLQSQVFEDKGIRQTRSRPRPVVPSRAAIVANDLPRKCGLATFTTDLCDAIHAEYGANQVRLSTNSRITLAAFVEGLYLPWTKEERRASPCRVVESSSKARKVRVGERQSLRMAGSGTSRCKSLPLDSFPCPYLDTWPRGTRNQPRLDVLPCVFPFFGPLSIQRRIGILDFVLSNLPYRYLETEPEKMSFFSDQRKAPRHSLPSKIYCGQRTSRPTLRYFVDKFPGAASI
jgi:hypothetical protein